MFRTFTTPDGKHNPRLRGNLIECSWVAERAGQELGVFRATLGEALAQFGTQGWELVGLDGGQYVLLIPA